MDNSRARGNGFKLREGRFRLDVRGKLFTESGEVLEQLPGEVVDALSLKVFKDRLDEGHGLLRTIGGWLE